MDRPGGAYPGGVHDEMRAADGAVREGWAELAALVERARPAGLAAATRQLLADELKVPLESVTVAEQRERTWPDAQLGCAPRKGVFEPVPTPGYEFQVMHAGRRYQVRADRAGLLKRCDGTPSRRDGPAGKPKPRG